MITSLLAAIPVNIGKESGKHGNNGTSGHHKKYNIIKIGKNIEKSTTNLRRFTVTHDRVKNH